jgi:hypothetical protein
VQAPLRPAARATPLQISDLLRDLLLNEESENSGLYSEEERDEFLWRLFGHLVLGGSCCQFEVGCPDGADSSGLEVCSVKMAHGPHQFWTLV